MKASTRGFSWLFRTMFCALIALAIIFALPGRDGMASDAVFTQRPKIRAITAFIKLDREQYQKQVHDALTFLHAASDAFKKSGYDVQGIRITTQPFPEYAGDLTGRGALDFFHDYDRLAAEDGFDASIGPAMMNDRDDPRQALMLAKILEQTNILEGSLVIAGEDGVHWHAIRAASRLISDVAEHTAHSQGNFRFAATAMLKSGTPFYPGSYYTGVGNQFALALQSANVVDEAFSRSHDPEEAEKILEQALEVNVRSLDGTARALAQQYNWLYGGVDLTPAPLKEVSIGGAIEHFTGQRFQRHFNSSRHHHTGVTRSPICSRRLFGADAAYSGGFRTGGALGAGRYQHGRIAGLFGSLRDRLGYRTAAGRRFTRATRAHSRRCRIAGIQME